MRKTNSSGNVLDTRQKILCAALVVVWVGGGVVKHLATKSYSIKVALELLRVELSWVTLGLTFCSSKQLEKYRSNAYCTIDLLICVFYTIVICNFNDLELFRLGQSWILFLDFTPPTTSFGNFLPLFLVRQLSVWQKMAILEVDQAFSC